MLSHPRIGLALAALVVSGSALPASAQTVDQVVARYLQARGGLERIRAVQSLRFTGKMILGEVETPLVVELKRPHRMRTEFEVQGRTLVRAYDGQKGWTILPLPGLDRPRLMPEDESRDAREQADVDLSPLVDSAAKGYQVQLLGREKLDGRETFRLLVRAADGSERTLLLDTRTALAVQSQENRVMDGKLQEFVTVIGDYRPVAGLVFPHSIEVGPRGGTERQRLTFERIEVNPALDDARFTMPAAEAAGRP
jgi:outer membrane lipoprotein-sorting protein